MRASLLAFGDAGARPDDRRDYPVLLRVAAAVAAADRARPADALVVLGDNFYLRPFRQGPRSAKAARLARSRRSAPTLSSLLNRPIGAPLWSPGHPMPGADRGVPIGEPYNAQQDAY